MTTHPQHAEFIASLGGLAADFEKMAPAKKIALFDSWCTRNNYSARVTTSGPRPVPAVAAPIVKREGDAPTPSYDVEAERLLARIARLDQRPAPRGTAARAQHEKTRQHLIDRVAGIRRRQEAAT